MSAKMTDQPSSHSEPSNSNLELGGPSLPQFRPLPTAESSPAEHPALVDDEPSPFISDRIKSGHLGKAEAHKDIWIWAAIAVGLLALAIFGLAQRPSEAPSDVQITEPQAE